MRDCLGVGVAVGAYGFAFGAASVASGLSALQTCLLSLLAFTGGTQFAVVGVVAGQLAPMFQGTTDKAQAKAVIDQLVMLAHQNGLSGRAQPIIADPEAAAGPDPRFEALMDYSAARPEIAADPVFRLVKMNSEVAPDVLKKHGKTKNPYPNVDSSSGVLFHHYGFHETLYYTATFGVSRGLGPLAQLIWDRALGLPIERPKSINLEGLLAKIES